MHGNKLVKKAFNWVEMQTTNGYKIEIIYFYYIVIKVYVLICTNIHSHIYFLCITIMSRHFSSTNFSHSQIMLKPLKIKFSILFTSLFCNIFHSYNKLSIPFTSLFHNIFHSYNKLLIPFTSLFYNIFHSYNKLSIPFTSLFHNIFHLYNKLSIPFISLFHNIFHLYNKLLLSNEGAFKGFKQSLIY